MIPMTHQPPLFSTSRIYAVTPDIADIDALLLKVEAVLKGGIGLLQYRNKLASHKLQTQQARALLPLCRQYNIPLIINDNVDLCLQLDADGVHLGADDGNIAEVRQKIGGKILGASCYNQLDLAIAAEKAGASYVAFGACFASFTKPHAPVADLNLFAQSKQKIQIPLVAIGGITHQNVHLIKQADAVAVINAIFAAANITKATQQFNCLFEPNI